MKRTFNSITLIFISIFFAACNSDKAPTVSAENFTLKWELLENQLKESQHKARFTLVNSGPALTGTDWAIYYNQGAGNTFTFPAGSLLKVEFIMGSFYRLIPTEAFTELPQGGTISLDYVADGFIAKNSQQPLTPYFVAPDGKATTIAEYYAADLNIDSPEIQKIAQFPLPTPANLFEKNKALTKLPLSQVTRVVPTPLSVKPGKGTFILQTPLVIYFEEGLANEASFLKDVLAQVLSGEIKVEEGKGQSLQLKLKSDGKPVGKPVGKPESYTLSINTTGIQVTGADAAGVFYGMQSLRALLPIASYATPSSGLAIDQLTIEDEPRYPYRGMFLDVARNFESKETVKKLLNLMAFYKLNYLHFHISEDEAWRLEIPGLPELTTIGARRGHTTTEEEFLHPEYGSGPDPGDQKSPGNGFYTRADFIEILKHAKSRNIKVITEVDIPGHSRAAIVAMKARYNRLMKEGKTEEANQYALHDPEDQSKYLSIQNFSDNVMCVCRPSAVTFMEKVFDEIILMYKDADAPLESIHIGGDEVPKGVWEGSPICQEFMKTRPDLKKSHDLMPYFIGELVKALDTKGLITSGWQEIAMKEGEAGDTKVNPEFINSGMRPYVWVPEPDLPYRLANAGYTPIIATASKLYFDLAANNDPEVPGQTWAGYVDTRSAWELVPNNVFYSSEFDARGNAADPEELIKKSVMLTPEGEKNILGLQGELWTEVAKTPELVDYFVYPKLLGLAERAWAANPEWATISGTVGRKREREKAWNLFVNTVGQQEMPRLSYLEGGVKYRIPRPGALIENGQLMANVEYPGLTIRYTTDGSEPTAASTEYTEPIAVNRTVKLKCFDASGRSGLTAVVTVN